MKENDLNKIEIYKTPSGTEIEIKLHEDSVWMNAHLIATLFNVQRPAIVKHINNIYRTEELSKSQTCSILEQVAADGKKRKMNLYNLDIIISVGYRVNSKKATLFRKWATQRLKEFLIDGYTINKRRLKQKKQEVLYLKTGIKILNRALSYKTNHENKEILNLFSKALELLDNYDHEKLDIKGITTQDTIYPSYENYIDFISEMYSDFKSDVFAIPKDESFRSSINQIKQTFNGVELYPTIQEKSANLLYSIVKNHSFIDGNKRIAAACFIYFLNKNQALFKKGKKIIDNNTLAALTLFIATSKTEELDIVKQLIISILNESRK